MSVTENPNLVEIPADVTGPDAPTEDPKGGEETLYAGKFKSVEDLEKSYQELQSLLGQRGKAPDAAPDASEDGADQPEDVHEEKPEEKAEQPKFIVAEKTEEQRTYERETYGTALSQLFDAAKIDAKALSESYYETGKFPEEAYAALEEQGISRAIVDSYLRGSQENYTESKVLAEAQINEVKGTVGGDEGYSKLMQWAKTNLTQVEQDRYDKIMGSGDLDLIKMTVAGLKARYDAAYGIDPNLVGGRSKGSPGKDAFRSTQEVVDAMRDPRYGRDPAYTKEVEEKVARSDVFQSTR